MNVYLAGPMRGYPKSNFPAFFDAALRLRAMGHKVFSPAELDIENGFSYDGTPPEGFSLRETLADDLGYLCESAELVVVLPGWEASLGTVAEMAAARALGIPVVTLYLALEDRDASV